MQKTIQTSSIDQQNDHPNHQQTSTRALWQGPLRQRKWHCVRLDVHRCLCLHLHPPRLLRDNRKCWCSDTMGTLIMQPLVWTACLFTGQNIDIANQDQYMVQTNPNNVVSAIQKASGSGRAILCGDGPGTSCQASTCGVQHEHP